MAKKSEKMTREEFENDSGFLQGRRKYYDHQEKILRKKMQGLTRAERTHQLCTRGAMLEGFLQEPDLLTDDQVKELLRIAFRQKDVREALEKILKDAENDV